MNRRSKTTVYKDGSLLFYIAVGACLTVFISYTYFLSNAIVHVVMRKEVDTQIAGLGTSVSQLEETYIQIQHSISTDIATHRGFVVADKKIFIDRGEGTLVFSRN